ncbi:MAG: hypothetical protein U5N58_05270 [Actinomycetota bacterium]|nr:hypothetical protein [Actinomycetota bacterium]
MLKIVIASRNDGKISEIKGYSKQANKKIEWITYKDAGGFPPVEEDGDTFSKIPGSRLKLLPTIPGPWW